MSITRMPNGRIKVRWRDNLGAHRAKTFKQGEMKLAKAFEDEVDRAKRLDYLPDLEAAKATIGELAADWWEAHGSRNAPRTVALYHQLLHGHVLPTFDGVRIGEVSAADIERWMARLRTGPSAKRNALKILNRIFEYAQRGGYVHKNPCLVAIKPKMPPKEPIRPPAPIEVERIRYRLFAMDRPADAYFVGFLAYAGPRSQEARDARWEDVQERTILLRSSKTGRQRAVRLLEPLAIDLAEWRLQAKVKGIGPWAGKQPIFPASTGKPFTKVTYDNWRKRVWSEVAPKGMRPYDLRHTYVSLLIRDPDVSRTEAAAFAGHSLQQQSDDYAHVFSELEGTGSAAEAIRDARREVFGMGTAEADAQEAGR